MKAISTSILVVIVSISSADAANFNCESVKDDVKYLVTYAKQGTPGKTLSDNLLARQAANPEKFDLDYMRWLAKFAVAAAALPEIRTVSVEDVQREFYNRCIRQGFANFIGRPVANTNARPPQTPNQTYPVPQSSQYEQQQQQLQQAQEQQQQQQQQQQQLKQQQLQMRSLQQQQQELADNQRRIEQQQRQMESERQQMEFQQQSQQMMRCSQQGRGTNFVTGGCL